MKNGKVLLRNYDLFIFDWDGTLCEMRTVLRANENLKRALKTWNREARIKEMESRPRNRLKRDIQIEETKNELLAILFESFAHLYRPRLHRNAMELLMLLKKRRKKVAILSNGNSSRLSKDLDKMGIRKYFDLVVSAKDIGATKPDPRGIRIIISKLKATPSRTLYFGDMIDDILTADLAKVDSCAVSNGFDSHAKLKSAKPTYLFESVEGIFSQMAR